MQRCLCLLGLLLVLSATLPLAGAITIVVDPNGGGDATTIQAGVDLAASGDQVLVLPGHYDEHVVCASKSLTLLSSGGALQTTIDGTQTGPTLFVSSAPAFRVEGFTLMRGWSDGYGGAIAFSGASQAVIRANRITTNYAADGGAGVFIPGGVTAQIEDNEFINNNSDFELGEGPGICIRIGSAVIRGNRFTEGYGRRGGGVSCYMGSVTIEENIFEENHVSRGGAGVFVGLSDAVVRHNLFLRNVAERGGGGFQVSEGGSPLVEGNTFVDNDSPWPYAGGIQLGTGAFEGEINNNILVGSAQYGIHAIETVTAGFACNDVYDNTLGNYGGTLADLTGVDGNFSADPAFCDPSADDYTLSSSSPCAPGNHPQGAACGLIGWYEVGCGATPVQEVSWGRLKSMFSH